ncbi:hypothetical protein J437_LFUL006782 [Ladona fulva]|uniref:Protein Wnt n=1 Tax=Ladona fulva TaxID=123851 RepID=A0A8K0NS85_LADFU|nr:hypothetical protein J437_LFUL006782 [Ladona fulva]
MALSSLVPSVAGRHNFGRRLSSIPLIFPTLISTVTMEKFTFAPNCLFNSRPERMLTSSRERERERLHGFLSQFGMKRDWKDRVPVVVKSPVLAPLTFRLFSLELARKSSGCLRGILLTVQVWKKGNLSASNFVRKEVLAVSMSFLILHIYHSSSIRYHGGIGIGDPGVPISGGGVAAALGAGVLCSLIPGLTNKQRSICKSAPDAVAAVGVGVRLGRSECAAQFGHRRWNCTPIGSDFVFGHVVVVGSYNPIVLKGCDHMIDIRL